MPACAKQLLALLKENMEEGAVHLRQKPRQQAPPPIVPRALSLGKDLRITDINSLELSRQLTIICSQKFRDIRVRLYTTLTNACTFTVIQRQHLVHCDITLAALHPYVPVLLCRALFGYLNSSYDVSRLDIRF